jgi:hypothetical protein
MIIVVIVFVLNDENIEINDGVGITGFWYDTVIYKGKKIFDSWLIDYIIGQ